MKMLPAYNRCPRRFPPGRLAQWTALAVLIAPTVCHAQPPSPPQNPPVAPANAPAQTPKNDPQNPPERNAPQSAADAIPLPGPPALPGLDVAAERLEKLDEATGEIRASGNVRVGYPGVTITADRVEGNIRREIVFSGNAKIEARGAASYADSIHFYPARRAYRLENPRGLFSPEFLQNRVTEPFFVNGGTLFGTRSGYALAEKFSATSCVEEHKHYELRARSAELIPGQRLILRRVGVYFFGQKIVVIPYLVIPLDKETSRRPRTDYLPEFGRNINEGYFARFPYTFALGAAAATFLRLDTTQKRGFGYRAEQEYLAGKQESAYSTSGYGGGFNGGFGGQTGEGSFNAAYGYGSTGALPRLGTGIGPQNGGLLALQGYFADGFSRNFNGSFRHQQGIGGSNRFTISTELQRNSFYTFQNQTSQNSRFDFSHADPSHGVNATATLSLQTNNSAGFGTNQITGSLNQSFEFDSRAANRNTLTYGFDLSRILTTSDTLNNRTARLDSKFEFRHFSRDYNYSLLYNKDSPLGAQTNNSGFGTLERLPELQMSLDSINFKGGWLRQLPTHFDIGVGRYSEPGSNTQTERVLLGFNIQDYTIMRGRTEMTTGGGFEQRIYGDSAAQYIVRNTTRLRQHLGGRSGFDLNYQYQQPEGGTPFLFDTFGRTHNLSAEAGYLDDSHFQMTARVGYDFLGTSSLSPWQSLSTRLMWRPSASMRLDTLSTFDPNTGKFFSVTNSLRFRGRSDFALDLFSRYDPQQGKFSQVNGQFDIPISRKWRVAGLLRYNGISGKFESTNLQVTHRWDCMEASLTYTETPLGFRNDKSLFLSIRITAFPFFRSFARGPGGDALGPGLGELY